LLRSRLRRFQFLKLAIQEQVPLKIFPAGWTDREMWVDVLGSRYGRPPLPNCFRQFSQFRGR
jgi:hypothetical protein